MRLLPDDPELGWTPFAYLVYLVPFLAYPVADARTTGWQWLAYGVALLLFLALYFRAYWERGRRLIVIACGIAALGFALVPWNAGAAVYFIYAGACAGRVGPSRRAAGWILGLTGTALLQGWLMDLHPWAYLPAVVFTPLIGWLTLHDAERRRADARLRLAQDEVQRLATVAERERIARDLHDLLGHTLSVIVLKSELASRLGDRDAARAVQEIKDVERISREALAEVRRAVHGYRSSGFRDEVARARETLEAAGVELVADLMAIDLPPVEDHALALIVREAVTNVVRHARASRCVVALSQDARRLLLTVSDDGVGAHGGKGNGLAGMHDRVEELRGRFSIEASCGTTITVELPVSDVRIKQEAVR
jgi:two-component system sensor histidine kinase DesK